MSVSKTITQKLRKEADKLSDFFEDASLSEEEKKAIDEAERLADKYADIKPDQLVVNSNYLFSFKH